MPYTTNNTFGGRTQSIPVQPIVQRQGLGYVDPNQSMWDNWAPGMNNTSNPFAGAVAGALTLDNPTISQPPSVDAQTEENFTWPEGSDYWYRIQQVQMEQAAAAARAQQEQQAALLAQQRFTEDARRWQAEQQAQQATLGLRQQEATATEAYRQQQLAAEQAWRTQQLEAEKQQRLATLAAQPKSWLEYAALSNQAPVVQPWMLPLMPQDYQQQVGSPIQGWTPQNMKGMPDLTLPSAQYMARLSPSMKEQYQGYQQADQGMTPEDSQWAIWNQGPASGGMKLNQTR
jgi:hypothetical protein